jgi:serine/threonine protein kinase HipA of HipAB toxin-antitoxin module
MIFNVRAGNADDHGKNHSFILDEDTRSWTLAPAYDLTLSFSEGWATQVSSPVPLESHPGSRP